MDMSRTRSFGLWTASLLLMATMVYLLLVVADYAFFKYVRHLWEQSEPARIEQARIRDEDGPLRDVARQNGFRSMFYPGSLDRYPELQALAQRHGVAPLAPQPDTKIYFCNEGYGLITYRTDRFGFRNDDARWDSRVDIVLIGDSFVHGACVEDRETISGELLPRFNALNLGTAANDPIHYAALTKTFVPEIKPRGAVMVFYPNDNDAGNIGSYFYSHYFGSNGRYFKHEAGRLMPGDDVMKFYSEARAVIETIIGEEDERTGFFERGSLLKRMVPYFSLPHIRSQVRVLFGSLEQEIPFSSRLAIDTLVSSCREAGCIPVVAYIPNSAFWHVDPFAKGYAKSLKGYAAAKGVRFIDATEVIDVRGREDYSIKGSHLSPRGYRLVAGMIREAAERSGDSH